jgi:hypothetical protein
VKTIETKVVLVKPQATHSSVASRDMKITMVRLPWEPKVEVKEAA